MPDSSRLVGTKGVAALSTTIKEMAQRLGAEFVLDERKAQTYVAAKEAHRTAKTAKSKAA
jgi:hypothetical protein